MVAGNRLLDAMASSAAAGMHAAKYAAGVNFSGRTALETYLGVAEADLDFDMAGAEEGPVQRAGPLFAKLTQIMNTHLGKERDGTGIDTAIEQLTELQSAADKLHIDDNSRLFNSNLVEALRLKAGIRLAIATAQSAKSRTESRGTHQRSDFEETDIEQMHHTLVNKEGEISSLALRKGRSGTWILPPEV
jgi:fumarate reductase flavoprotein subunit